MDRCTGCRALWVAQETWQLYQWGVGVEILAPERLRQMVDAHRRTDFAALP